MRAALFETVIAGPRAVRAAMRVPGKLLERAGGLG